MSLKILFLDIDGVVNCAATTQRHGPYIGIDPTMAARVKRIIAETGCKVVLSSTWRHDVESRAEVKRKVCDFIDRTPGSKFNGQWRGQEVQAWINLCSATIDEYAILDDDADFYPDQPLFKTEWPVGLTDEIADKVIAYLNYRDKK